MLSRLLVACLALGLVAPAAADPRQDLRKAYVSNLALKSYKATMIDMASNKTLSTIEFQAPDRYRVAAGGQAPSVIVGDTMYLNAGGQSIKVPLPKDTLGQLRNDKTISDLEKNISVESAGAGAVGGQPARKYRFRSSTADQESSSTVWIGAASGHVLQVETSGKHGGKPYAMRMVYSDCNSPAIRINAPK